MVDNVQSIVYSIQPGFDTVDVLLQRSKNHPRHSKPTDREREKEIKKEDAYRMKLTERMVTVAVKAAKVS